MATNVYEGMFLLDSNRYARDPGGVSNEINQIVQKCGKRHQLSTQLRPCHLQQVNKHGKLFRYKIGGVNVAYESSPRIRSASR